MRRSYEFRLYPTPLQVSRLQGWLDLCRDLYNAALQQRRDEWTSHKKSLGKFDQKREIPPLREQIPAFKDVNTAVLQDVIGRVDKAFQGFFRRVKRGETPGYPRFQGSHRYQSFTHPQASTTSWTERRIRIPSFGWIRWKPWKSLVDLGNVKTLTVRRRVDGWFITLSCEVQKPKDLPATGQAIGIDIGLKEQVVTSEGEALGDLKALKAKELQVRKAQQRLSQKTKGSNRYRKARQILARRSLDLTRARKANLDRITRKLVNENDVIAVEDLDVVSLTNLGHKIPVIGRGMRRNWKHVEPGLLIHMLTYKAEEAGRRVVKVDPRGTTQECSGCGKTVPKNLSVRVHDCPHCGLVLDRDHNAARVVLKRSLRLLRPEGREDRLGLTA